MIDTFHYQLFITFVFVLLFRNSAVDLIEQELLFVGSERGKLVAIRNIILKV